MTGFHCCMFVMSAVSGCRMRLTMSDTVGPWAGAAGACANDAAGTARQTAVRNAKVVLRMIVLCELEQDANVRSKVDRPSLFECGLEADAGRRVDRLLVEAMTEAFDHANDANVTGRGEINL